MPANEINNGYFTEFVAEYDDGNQRATATLPVAAAKLRTKRAIDGVKFDGTADVTHYCTCDTAANVAAKVATPQGGGTFSLVVGAWVYVKFYNDNTAEPDTGNGLTLKVGESDAKPIRALVNGRTRMLPDAGLLDQNTPKIFIYDGNFWVAMLNYDTDTDTIPTNLSLGQGYGTCDTAEATAAKAVTMANYALSKGGIVAVRFDNAVPASATMNVNGKGAKQVWHKGTAIAAGVIRAGDTATFIYDGSHYVLVGIDRLGDGDGIANGIVELHSEPVEDDYDIAADTLCAVDVNGVMQPFVYYDNGDYIINSAATFIAGTTLLYASEAYQGGDGNPDKPFWKAYGECDLTQHTITDSSNLSAGRRLFMKVIVNKQNGTFTIDGDNSDLLYCDKDDYGTNILADGSFYVLVGNVSERTSGNGTFFLQGENPVYYYDPNKGLVEWAAHLTKVMEGATASADGEGGTVPTPPSNGHDTKFLRADGIWAAPAAGTTYTAGDGIHIDNDGEISVDADDALDANATTPVQNGVVAAAIADITPKVWVGVFGSPAALHQETLFSISPTGDNAISKAGLYKVSATFGLYTGNTPSVVDGTSYDPATEAIVTLLATRDGSSEQETLYATQVKVGVDLPGTCHVEAVVKLTSGALIPYLRVKPTTTNRYLFFGDHNSNSGSHLCVEYIGPNDAVACGVTTSYPTPT